VLKVQRGDTGKTRCCLQIKRVLYGIVGLGALYFAYTNYTTGNTQLAIFLALVGLLSFYLGFKH
jgi:hypothetical protein